MWRSGFSIFDLAIDNPEGLGVCSGNEAYMQTGRAELGAG